MNNLLLTQISVTVGFVGLVIVIMKMALSAARDAGARDEREKQMKLDLDSVKAKASADVQSAEARVTAALEAARTTSNERYKEIRESLANTDSIVRDFERVAVRLEEGFTRLSQDVNEVKVTVGGMGKEFEHTIRNMLAGKYEASRTRSRGAQG